MKCKIPVSALILGALSASLCAQEPNTLGDEEQNGGCESSAHMELDAERAVLVRHRFCYPRSHALDTRRPRL